MKKDTVLKTEGLAKLVLGKDRFKKISNDFSSIIEYIDVLQKADVQDLSESFNASGLTNVSSPDKPVESDHLSQAEALANAKRSYKGFIQVEKVI